MADDDGNEIVCPMCRHWPCSCKSPHPQERDISADRLKELRILANPHMNVGRAEMYAILDELDRLRTQPSPREVALEKALLEIADIRFMEPDDALLRRIYAIVGAAACSNTPHPASTALERREHDRN